MSKQELIAIWRLTLRTELPCPIKVGPTITFAPSGLNIDETIEIREMAEKEGVQLFCIPPHTSHRLQPLDVGVFGPVQRAWQKRCLAVLEETGESLARCMEEVRDQASKP